MEHSLVSARLRQGEMESVVQLRPPLRPVIADFFLTLVTDEPKAFDIGRTAVSGGRSGNAPLEHFTILIELANFFGIVRTDPCPLPFFSADQEPLRDHFRQRLADGNAADAQFTSQVPLHELRTGGYLAGEDEFYQAVVNGGLFRGL